MIIDPRGEIIAGPLEGEGILMAEGSLETVRAAKAACDIAGHYSRPDVFNLLVNDAVHDRRAMLASDEDFEDEDLAELLRDAEDDELLN